MAAADESQWDPDRRTAFRIRQMVQDYEIAFHHYRSLQERAYRGEPALENEVMKAAIRLDATHYAWRRSVGPFTDG